MDIVKEVESWVKKNYLTDNHLLRSKYWLRELKPNADLANIIAVITHDIERGFPKNRKPPSPDVGGAKWDDKEYNLWHGKRSARFALKFLRRFRIDSPVIKKVKKLITYHEIGGDKERDLIKDVDSISFFENNISLFYSWIPKRASKNEIKEKFDYMFNRISSVKARKLALPFYQKALKDLENL